MAGAVVNIAQIAAKALNAAQGAITDAVHAATISHDTQGTYSVTSGAYDLITTTQTGRAVFHGVSAAKDVFPEYLVGPSDQMLMLEGFTSVAENDVLVVHGVSRTIRAVQDIGGAASLFTVIAR